MSFTRARAGIYKWIVTVKPAVAEKIVAVGLLLCGQSGDDIFGAAEQLIMAPLKWETARQESLTQPRAEASLARLP